MMLRARFIPITMLLSLVACQSPVVPVRSYTFNASFVADGQQHVLSTSYQCHYEDMTWLSERGPDWHIRKGTAAIRIVGQLADGTAFEVLPSPPTPDVFCSENIGPIRSQLFIATPEGASSIEQTTDRIAPHNARLLQTSLSLVSTDSGTFLDHEDWPAPTEPKQHFYTIQTTDYDASLWKQEHDIVAMVRNKSVPWLGDMNVWPFTKWTDDDVAFARARESHPRLNGYADAGKRFPVAIAGEEWHFSGPNNDVVVWRPAPVKPDVKHWNEPGITRWIEYDGARIELPLHAYYRLFYEQKSDRLIEFRAVQVDLW